MMELTNNTRSGVRLSTPLETAYKCRERNVRIQKDPSVDRWSIPA